MPTVNLTAAFVKSIQPNGKRMDYFDEDVPGFSLRVSEKGVKSWCVSFRFAGKWTRYTFSNVTKHTLKEARNLRNRLPVPTENRSMWKNSPADPVPRKCVLNGSGLWGQNAEGH